jgi:hypothetical protein
MKTKHTPGPWNVFELPEDDYEGGGMAVGKPEFLGRKAPDGKAEIHVCLMAGHPEDKANARLIAAAPSLLEACRHLIDALYSDPEQKDMIAKHALNIVRKATGED